MGKTKKKTQMVIQGLLDYLAEVKEEKLLPEIVQELKAQVEGEKRPEKIIVTSYLPLKEEELGRIREKVNQFLGFNLPVENRIEKKILGGLKIQIGDWFFDASLLGQLENLKKILLS